MKSLVFMICVSIFAYAQKLEGLYQTESFLYIQSSLVEFFKFQGKYYAYAIANTNGSPAQKDTHNPNPALRNRTDKGVVFLYDLKQTSPSTYEQGRVYNFYDGRTYYVHIHQKKNGDLSFFVSLYQGGIIGKSFLWKHINEDYLQKHHITKPDFNNVLKSLSQINP
ncbi:hypothetical protein BKH46_00335 [Helicobacter sp. 12S02634-8]|uniref:DUF2147 domain-containing protein n=1 Tax=Helicobacter sp. 12S02634-8 TaxID=1476199 RepID=UPI000BA5CB0C|nr:DUF2147 domain-containing protein [Helicobacter sp. 12S02634-8]PAF48396.1 hypothetical protein BKH46_00335 [Helicobacter sp. 12S02634-8]